MKRYRGAERTLGRVVREQAARYGDKACVVTDGRRGTYGELDALSDQLAGGVRALGIGAGETVLVMLPNTVEFIGLWWGLAKLGAIEVPVNTAYRGSVLAHVINDSRATTLVVDRQYLERVARVAGELTGLRRLVVCDEGGGQEGEVPGGLERFERRAFAELVGEPARAVDEGPGHTDLMAVMYTSGTTGPSKGVMITHAHAYEYARASAELIELGPDDVFYGPLPLFHVSGRWSVVYGTCLAGGTVVLPRQFSVSGFWGDVRQHGVTTTYLLGAMANLLYRQPPSDTDATTPLRKIAVVPLFPEIEDFKRRFGVRVTTAYGSTEVNVPIRMGFDLPDARSCGRVVAGQYEVRVVDEWDEEVPAGVIGELVVRAKEPWIMTAGYWQHPEWTVGAWRNLWFHTGDAMYRDGAGNFYFVDRLKDAIRRRGENISSVEVENEINGHPGVVESAVVGVRSEHTEEEVKAVVVVREGAEVTAEGLIAYLEPRLPYFMVPRYVEFAESLPKTPTGKIRKVVLREQGVTAGTWDREKAGVRVRR